MWCILVLRWYTLELLQCVLIYQNRLIFKKESSATQKVFVSKYFQFFHSSFWIINLLLSWFQLNRYILILYFDWLPHLLCMGKFSDENWTPIGIHNKMQKWMFSIKTGDTWCSAFFRNPHYLKMKNSDFVTRKFKTVFTLKIDV